MSKTGKTSRQAVLELSKLDSGYENDSGIVSPAFYKNLEVKPVNTIGIDVNVMLDPVKGRKRSTEVPLNSTQKQRAEDVLGKDFVEEYWVDEDSSMKSETGALYPLGVIKDLSPYFDLVYPDTFDRAVEGSKFSERATDADLIDRRYDVFMDYLESVAEPIEVEARLDEHDLEDDAIYEALTEYKSPALLTYDSDFVQKDHYSDVLALPPEMMNRMIEENSGRTGLDKKRKV